MWHDVILLIRHQGMLMARNAAYWLRVIGWDHQDSRLFRAYVISFWLFWAFAMWAFLVDQVERISYQVPSENTTAFLDGFPIIVFSLQVLYLLRLFFAPPLKLIAPDLTYIATSPLSRGAVVTVHFVSGLLGPATALGLLGALLAMLFAWSVDAPSVGLSGVQAFFVTFALVYLSGAISWTVALARQSCRMAAARHALWLLLPAIIFGVWLVPDLFLWPGQAWTASIGAEFQMVDVLWLIAGLVVSFAGLCFAGNKTHMTQVMDLSQIHARIHKLGFWGRIEAADVIARLRAQARLAKTECLRGRLPVTFDAPSVLLGLSRLTLARLSPGILLRLVASGLTFTSLGFSLVMLGGLSSVQTWALLFIVLIRLRFDEVTRGFSGTVRQPFLRQFLPQGNLLLFLSQTSIPFLIMSIGIALAAVSQPWVHPAIAFLLATGVAFALALCRALESVRLPAHLLGDFRYEYAILFLGAFVLTSGYLLQSIWAALLATLVVDFALTLLLHRSLRMSHEGRSSV